MLPFLFYEIYSILLPCPKSIPNQLPLSHTIIPCPNLAPQTSNLNLIYSYALLEMKLGNTAWSFRSSLPCFFFILFARQIEREK